MAVRNYPATDRYEKLIGVDAGYYVTEDGWYRIKRERHIFGGEWFLYANPDNPLTGADACGQYRTMTECRDQLIWEREWAAENCADEIAAIEAAKQERREIDAKAKRLLAVIGRTEA